MIQLIASRRAWKTDSQFFLFFRFGFHFDLDHNFEKRERKNLRFCAKYKRGRRRKVFQLKDEKKWKKGKQKLLN